MELSHRNVFFRDERKMLYFTIYYYFSVKVDNSRVISPLSKTLKYFRLISVFKTLKFDSNYGLIVYQNIRANKC